MTCSIQDVFVLRLKFHVFFFPNLPMFQLPGFLDHPNFSGPPWVNQSILRLPNLAKLLSDRVLISMPRVCQNRKRMEDGPRHLGYVVSKGGYFKPFITRSTSTLLRGLTITMVVSNLLAGMILQVRCNKRLSIEVTNKTRLLTPTWVNPLRYERNFWVEPVGGGCFLKVC